MGGKTIRLPQDAIVQMLKSLPEDVLLDVFWKAFVAVDTSPLTETESAALRVARAERERGESVKWDDIRSADPDPPSRGLFGEGVAVEIRRRSESLDRKLNGLINSLQGKRRNQ